MEFAPRRGWSVWFAVAVLGSFAMEGRHALAVEQRKHTTPEAHASIIACLAITPDGKTLASGSFDNTINLWDLVTGKERATLRGHPGGVHAIALTRDGNTLASTSQDDFVMLWDVTTGRGIRTMMTGYRVWCLAFSADGKTLITAGEGPFKIWDVATGKEQATLDLLPSKEAERPVVSFVALTVDGKTLCAAHGDGMIRLWDLPTGKVRATIRTGRVFVSSLLLSPGDWTLGYALTDGTITLWDMATGRQRAQMKGAQARAWTLAFSPDGQTLASGGWDGNIRLWDAVTGKQRAVFPAHTASRVRAVTFTPDGKTLFSGAGKQMKCGELKRWDVSAIGTLHAGPSPDRRARAERPWARVDQRMTLTR